MRNHRVRTILASAILATTTLLLSVATALADGIAGTDPEVTLIRGQAQRRDHRGLPKRSTRPDPGHRLEAAA